MIHEPCFPVRSAMVIVASMCLVTAHAADIENGKVLFEEHCVACHTVIERVRDKSGPNLRGVFGRTAGTEEYSGGFSEEMMASGVIWEVATLQAFLSSPAQTIRGTKMVFRGLRDIEARMDITCYLERVTGDGSVPTNALCAEGR